MQMSSVEIEQPRSLNVSEEIALHAQQQMQSQVIDVLPAFTRGSPADKTGERVPLSSGAITSSTSSTGKYPLTTKAKPRELEITKF